MNTLITFLSADISVGFAFSITMVAILVMAAITQVIKSDYEDTICNMAKDMHESNERHQDLIYSLFDTIDDAQVIIDNQEGLVNSLFDTVDDAQVIIDNQEAELKQLRASNDIYQSVYKSSKPLTDEDEAELRKMEL